MRKSKYDEFVSVIDFHVFILIGSSRGRGTRAAGWFEDYIGKRDTSEDGTGLRSLILEGGIKGWVKGGAEYVREMDGYVEDVWLKQEEHQ